MLSLSVDAACLGYDMVFDEPPDNQTLYACLDRCYSCPVITECILLMKKQGDKYKYQVRGGRAVWISGIPWCDGTEYAILNATPEEN